MVRKVQTAVNLAELLELSAVRFGQRTALFFSDKKISYQELDAMVQRLSQGLRNLGIKEKDRVALLLPNCPEFIISYFAIVRISAIAVPINNLLKEKEIAFILSDAACSVMVTSVNYLMVIESLHKQCGAEWKAVILVDGLAAQTFNLYEIIERSIPRGAPLLPESDALASVLYTSGTTGNPKGAMLTHGNFLANVKSCVSTIRAREKDNFICLLPMFHSFAFTVCILIPLSVGAGITIVEQLRPFRKIIRNVIKKKVTIFVGVPPIFNVLAHMHIPAIFTSRVLKLIDPLRLCISGAAALPPEVMKNFEDKFKVPLLEGYGLTEAAPVVSLNPPRGRRIPGSVGLPIEGVEVRVINEDGAESQSGESGELLVKGANVMQGYWNNPPATTEAIKDSWLYTGDIAKIDREGYIYIVDRKKDMINVRGLNVYPAEIEKVLLSHPKIKEAAVIGISDKYKGEVPKAIIVLRENEKLNEREVIQFLKNDLASFKLPKFVEFKEDLPKTSTGKVLKRQLYAQGPNKKD